MDYLWKDEELIIFLHIRSFNYQLKFEIVDTDDLPNCRNDNKGNEIGIKSLMTIYDKKIFKFQAKDKFDYTNGKVEHVWNID